MPPTNAHFILDWGKGIRLRTSLAIDRVKAGRSSASSSSLRHRQARGRYRCHHRLSSPIANSAFTDADITFQSDDDTIYGSFMHAKAKTVTPGPAALIISGSGPTDRNGNSPS